MARHSKKKGKRIGLPPGTLEHSAAPGLELTKITLIDYDDKLFHAEQFTSVDALVKCKTSSTVSWINVDTVQDARLLERFGAVFGLHPLTLEDIQSVDQRPKMDDYEEYIYLDLKSLVYDAEKNEIVSEAISLALGPSWVMTFHEKESDVLNPIRDRIRSYGGRIRKMGADYLAYCLLDTLVDNYFPVLEKLDERIETLHEELMEKPTRETLRELNKLKKEVIFLRKTVWPLREAVVKLERSDNEMIKENTRVFLRDVYDHTVHIIESIESFRDLLAGMLDIYLSSANYRLNEVLKFLMIISTIFIPLTFLAGVYGMNFKHFPELEWQNGYYYFWGMSFAIAAAMLYYFRGKDWI